MAPKKTVTVILSDPDEKKHVVRYNNADEDAALSSVYVNKKAVKALGDPAKVKITIEAA
jgi:hypothetical protein